MVFLALCEIFSHLIHLKILLFHQNRAEFYEINKTQKARQSHYDWAFQKKQAFQ